MAQSRHYTAPAITIESVQEMVKQDPENDPDDILLAKENGARILTLNRPSKLNSLNGSMAKKLLLRLKVPDCEYVLADADSQDSRILRYGECHHPPR
jgi:hypothetical protein